MNKLRTVSRYFINALLAAVRAIYDDSFLEAITFLCWQDGFAKVLKSFFLFNRVGKLIIYPVIVALSFSFMLLIYTVLLIPTIVFGVIGYIMIGLLWLFAAAFLKREVS